MAKILNDSINLKDGIPGKKRGFWVDTEIIGGYGLHKDSNGVSQFNEVVFKTSNTVPISGVQYLMEVLIGSRSDLILPTFSTNGSGIGSSDVTAPSTQAYPLGNCIALFGIGTGGADSNNTSVNEIKYNETGLNNIVPFRYTSDTTSVGTEYFGKKVDNGITSYYLKTIESKKIHNVNDASEIKTPTALASAANVSTYIEFTLKISSEDTKEYFDRNGNTETARFNELGLYTAVKNGLDYGNIQLFSKLNIPTEPLSLTKDMEIIYRVYGS